MKIEYINNFDSNEKICEKELVDKKPNKNKETKKWLLNTGLILIIIQIIGDASDLVQNGEVFISALAFSLGNNVFMLSGVFLLLKFFTYFKYSQNNYLDTRKQRIGSSMIMLLSFITFIYLFFILKEIIFGLIAFIPCIVLIIFDFITMYNELK